MGIVLLLAFSGTAQAQSVHIDEARFGGAWIDMPFGAEESYYNYDFPGINGEVLFAPFDFDMSEAGAEGIVRTLLTPRLHVGTTISFDDATPSSIYTGLTWHHQFTERFFVETSFGGAWHDGETSLKQISATKYQWGLGSNLLFRESVSLGVNLTDTVNVLLQLTHISHAGLAGSENHGQTDLALKFGKEF